MNILMADVTGILGISIGVEFLAWSLLSIPRIMA
jgi:hypothetical protein